MLGGPSPGVPGGPAATSARAGVSDEGAARDGKDGGGHGQLRDPPVGVREPCPQRPCPFPVSSHTLQTPCPVSQREDHGMRPCAQTGRGAGQGLPVEQSGCPVPLSTQPSHESRSQMWGVLFRPPAPQDTGPTCWDRPASCSPENGSRYWQAAGWEAGLPDARARPRPPPGSHTQSRTQEGRNLARDMHTVCPAGPRGTPAAHSAPPGPQTDRTTQQVWAG